MRPARLVVVLMVLAAAWASQTARAEWGSRPASSVEMQLNPDGTFRYGDHVIYPDGHIEWRPEAPRWSGRGSWEERIPAIAQRPEDTDIWIPDVVSGNAANVAGGTVSPPAAMAANAREGATQTLQPYRTEEPRLNNTLAPPDPHSIALGVLSQRAKLGLTKEEEGRLRAALVQQVVTSLDPTSGKSAEPSRQPARDPSPEAKAMAVVALESEKAYRGWQNAWNWWQLIGTAVGFTFALGVGMVGAGCAYLHLKSKSETMTRLEIGSKGISLSTKVIGLIILLISYLFFQVAAHHAFTLVSSAR